MKKSLVVLAMIAFCSSAFSQDISTWKFSVNFTPLTTWTAGSGNVKSGGPRLGYELGLTAEQYFTERYAYYVGLSLMNIGGKLEGKDVPDNIPEFNSGPTLSNGQKAMLRFQYLAIPIGMKLKTDSYGNLSYYFQSAIFPAVRIGGAGYTKAFNEKPQEDLVSSDYNFFNLGLQIGGGAMYSVGNDTYLKLGLSFNYFFVDALRGNMDGQPAGLGLNLGFLF